MNGDPGNAGGDSRVREMATGADDGCRAITGCVDPHVPMMSVTPRWTLARESYWLRARPRSVPGWARPGWAECGPVVLRHACEAPAHTWRRNVTGVLVGVARSASPDMDWLRAHQFSRAIMAWLPGITV